MANVLAVVDGTNGTSLVLDRVERNPDFLAGFSEDDGVYRGFLVNESDYTEIAPISPGVSFTHCGADVKTYTEELQSLREEADNKRAPWNQTYAGAVRGITISNGVVTKLYEICVP